jgi:hypothetical protein
MKILILTYLQVLAAFSACKALITPELPMFEDSYTISDIKESPSNHSEIAGTPSADETWNRAKCKGQKLLLAMTMDRSNAARFVNPVDSPWDGDIFNALNTWGYKDDSEAGDVDGNCNFKQRHRLERAFQELGINPESFKNSGPNECYRIVHYDGPAVHRLPDGRFPARADQHYTVNNKRYRVRNATL